MALRGLQRDTQPVFQHQERRQARQGVLLGQLAASLFTEADAPSEDRHPAQRKQNAAQRQRQVQRQTHVQGQELPQDHEQQRPGEQRPGPESSRFAPHAPGREGDGEDRAQRRERGVQAGCEFVVPEQLEGERRRPVLERGLFDVHEAVQMRHDPVAARDHLARNLGVAALVRIEQRPERQHREPEDGDQPR